MKYGSDLRMRGQGIGSVHQFVCMRCNQTRPTLGRRYVTWRRVKTFVCAECVKAMAKDKASDAGNFELVTRLVNGGTNGLVDRLNRWERAKRVLGVRETTNEQA